MTEEVQTELRRGRRIEVVAPMPFKPGAQGTIFHRVPDGVKLFSFDSSPGIEVKAILMSGGQNLGPMEGGTWSDVLGSGREFAGPFLTFMIQNNGKEEVTPFLELYVEEKSVAADVKNGTRTGSVWNQFPSSEPGSRGASEQASARDVALRSRDDNVRSARALEVGSRPRASNVTSSKVRTTRIEKRFTNVRQTNLPTPERQSTAQRNEAAFEDVRSQVVDQNQVAPARETRAKQTVVNGAELMRNANVIVDSLGNVVSEPGAPDPRVHHEEDIYQVLPRPDEKALVLVPGFAIAIQQFVERSDYAPIPSGFMPAINAAFQQATQQEGTATKGEADTVILLTTVMLSRLQGAIRRSQAPLSARETLEVANAFRRALGQELLEAPPGPVWGDGDKEESEDVNRSNVPLLEAAG